MEKIFTVINGKKNENKGEKIEDEIEQKYKNDIILKSSWKGATKYILKNMIWMTAALIIGLNAYFEISEILVKHATKDCIKIGLPEQYGF